MEEKRKRKRKRKRKSIVDIPLDVLVDIFSRLPAKRVWRIRSVCKDWKSLIEAPSFAYLHLRQPKERCFMVVDYVKHYYKTRFYSINRDGKAVCVVRDEFTHSNMTTTSCINGLISYLGTNGHINVWNPVTHELLILPPTTFLSQPQYIDLNQIGFDSTTKRYKVLVVSKRKSTKVEIITLGGRKNWRKIEAPLANIHSGTKIYANGCIYWFSSQYHHTDGDGNRIRALPTFNFAQEKFEFVPLPPDFDHTLEYYYHLHELGGCLCLLESKMFGVKMRVLANSGTQAWVNQHYIDQSPFEGIDYVFPISRGVMLVKSGYIGSNGSNLEKYICSYNEEGQIVKSIEIHDLPPGFSPRQLHTESIVSLKSILAAKS